MQAALSSLTFPGNRGNEWIRAMKCDLLGVPFLWRTAVRFTRANALQALNLKAPQVGP